MNVDHFELEAERDTRILTPEFVKSVCKIGQGADCCCFITLGKDGFHCEKWNMEQVETLAQKIFDTGGEKQSIHALLENRALLKISNAQSLGGEENHPGCIAGKFE